MIRNAIVLGNSLLALACAAVWAASYMTTLHHALPCENCVVGATAYDGRFACFVVSRDILNTMCCALRWEDIENPTAPTFALHWFSMQEMFVGSLCFSLWLPPILFGV